MKMLISLLLLTLVLISCIPKVDGDTLAAFKNCFTETIKGNFSENALTECLQAIDVKINQPLVEEIKKMLNEFGTIDLNKIIRIFFGVPDSVAAAMGDDNVKINLIVEKLKVIHNE